MKTKWELLGKLATWLVVNLIPWRKPRPAGVVSFLAKMEKKEYQCRFVALDVVIAFQGGRP